MIATILSGRGGAQHMDAEQYRRCARRYLIRASQMISPVNRVTMIDMAAIWMRMAERANPENLGPRGRIFQYEAFQPEHISVMGHVFEDVLRTIGGVNRQDPLAEKIAKKVIELAQTGDCDPLRLKELTLKAFDEDRISSWRLLWRGQLS
jgi:hypothetical protein